MDLSDLNALSWGMQTWAPLDTQGWSDRLN